MLKALFTASAGVVAAAGSALCCAGPLVAVTLGVSGAGLAGTFEPLRPYFLGATGLFLAGGFLLVHREERKACEPGKPCADERVRHRMKTTLWIATVLAAFFATYPTWSQWIF
ncbi:MAG: mercuric transporter MerT family protein [Gemmatimonadales bacterium]